jgi:hypothetical protein
MGFLTGKRAHVTGKRVRVTIERGDVTTKRVRVTTKREDVSIKRVRVMTELGDVTRKRVRVTTKRVHIFMYLFHDLALEDTLLPGTEIISVNHRRLNCTSNKYLALSLLSSEQPN